MSSFIYTQKGYVNLNRVEIAQHTKTTDHKIIVDGEVVDERNDFGTTIISMSPVQGEWECLLPCEEEDGTEQAISSPVIAWGLTVLGFAVPITPSDMGGVDGAHALRKTGDTRVFDQLGQEYKDAADWIASRSEQKRSTAAVPPVA
jgi:hypothetical protein